MQMSVPVNIECKLHNAAYSLRESIVYGTKCRFINEIKEYSIDLFLLGESSSCNKVYNKIKLKYA